MTDIADAIRSDALRAIWKKIGLPIPPRNARDMGSYKEIRALTKKEWATVVAAIKSGYPATIVSARYGFSFGIEVFEPSVPIYPGAEPDAPMPVFYATAWQFPGNDPRKNLDEQGLCPSVHHPRNGDGVFEEFMKICGTPENLAACARENVEPPGSRGSYAY